MQTMDLRQGIANISIPTVVMVGTRDRLTTPALADELVRAIAEAKLDTLPDAGHQLPLEAPGQITERILALTD